MKDNYVGVEYIDYRTKAEGNAVVDKTAVQMIATASKSMASSAKGIINNLMSQLSNYNSTSFALAVSGANTALSGIVASPNARQTASQAASTLANDTKTANAAARAAVEKAAMAKYQND